MLHVVYILYMYVYVCMFIYICIHTLYPYIYIYKQREITYEKVILNIISVSVLQ